MNLKQRIELLNQLGSWILDFDEELMKTIQLATQKNPWFTVENIQKALSGIANSFLQKDKLLNWSDAYKIDDSDHRTVALILAGNIPAVGFHDILCTFISNHSAQIKLSGKDDVLIPALIRKLEEMDNDTISYFTCVERIENFDALIATGSNNTSLYFEQYFSKYPHIIRKNRHAIGVIYNDTTEDTILQLGEDIYQYFGLGCRNISKLMLQDQVEKEKIMEIWHDNYKEVLQHNKYMNNFDYNYTIFLMNQDDFYMNGGLLLKKDSSIHSRISSVNYEEFTTQNQLENTIKSHGEDVQCIISEKEISSFQTVRPGQAQSPQLSDYADGVDVMSFLNQNL